MLVSKLLPKLQARSVLEDLAIRRGEPDQDAVCPWIGKAFYVEKALADKPTNIRAFLSSRADYNIALQKPTDGMYGRDEEGDEFAEVLTRFEDIDDTWPHKYFEDAILGITRYDNRGGQREYDNKNREQRAMIDEESSNVTVEADQMRIRYHESEKERAREKIPYLIKKIWKYSPEIGVNAVQWSIAYFKAKLDVDLRNGNKQYQSSIRKADICRYRPIWHVNNNGVQVERIDYYSDSSSVRSHFATAQYLNVALGWILGYAGDTDIRNCVFELKHECDILGIDITKENLSDYDASILNNLEISYLPTNREYLTPGGKSEIVSALRNISLDDAFDEVPSEQDTIIILVQNWRDDPRSFREDNNTRSYIEYFLGLYNRQYGTKYSTRLASWDTGIMVVPPNISVKFDVAEIFYGDFASNRCSWYLSDTAHLIRLTDNGGIASIDLKDVAEGGVAECRYI